MSNFPLAFARDLDGCRQKYTNFCQACMNNDPVTAEKYYNEDYLNEFSHPGGDRNTNALNYAIMNCSLEMIDYLLEKDGHDFRIRDKTGSNAVSLMCSNLNDPARLERLLKKHKSKMTLAVINNRDENGHTALHHAIHRNNKKIVQLLLKAGADVNLVHPDYNSNLEMAVDHGSRYCIKALMKAPGSKFDWDAILQRFPKERALLLQFKDEIEQYEMGGFNPKESHFYITCSVADAMSWMNSRKIPGGAIYSLSKAPRFDEDHKMAFRVYFNDYSSPSDITRFLESEIEISFLITAYCVPGSEMSVAEELKKLKLSRLDVLDWDEQLRNALQKIPEEDFAPEPIQVSASDLSKYVCRHVDE